MILSIFDENFIEISFKFWTNLRRKKDLVDFPMLNIKFISTLLLLEPKILVLIEYVTKKLSFHVLNSECLFPKPFYMLKIGESNSNNFQFL